MAGGAVAGFDPVAATAAYLAILSPAEHAKAIAYTRGGYWLLLWGALVSILAAWLVLRSGLLVRLRDRLDPDGTRPKRALLAIAATFLLATTLIELPWAIYARWWRERSYGLSAQPFASWLGDQAKALPISLIFTCLFLLALYTLIRRAPRLWWAWSSLVAVAGLILVLVITPIVIEPLFNTYTPAPPGPLRDTVVKLAEATGVPHDKIYIYNGSKQSERYTANVSGLFGSARVAMSDTMFAQNADRAEVVGVLGHEMGHYSRHDILMLVGGMSLIIGICLFLSDRLFPWLVARLPGGDAVRGLADPAGLPVLMIIVSALGLVAGPFMNSLTRIAETGADAFSLRYAHEPDGLARALVKTIAYRASSPNRVEEILFYNHPSVERRVRRAMDWKAAHPTGVGAPFGRLP
jgi:STE24 endopeptidase